MKFLSRAFVAIVVAGLSSYSYVYSMEDGDKQNLAFAAACSQTHKDAQNHLNAMFVQYAKQGIKYNVQHFLTMYPGLVENSDSLALSRTTRAKALRAAQENKHSEIVVLIKNSLKNQELLEQQGYLGTVCYKFRTAVRANDTYKVTDMLMEFGPCGNNIITVQELQLSLINAVKLGHNDAIKVLVAHGASVNKADNFDRLPIIVAQCAGKKETEKLLLSLGANSEPTIPTGLTTPTSAQPNSLSSLSSSSSSSSSAEAERKKLQGLFVTALKNEKHSCDLIKKLIGRGVAVIASDIDLLSQTNSGGHKEPCKMCEELLRASSCQYEFVNLIMAGKRDLVKPFLYSNAGNFSDGTPFISSTIRDTGLFLAAAWGHDGIVTDLLDVGADINTVSENGATPLIHAASNDHSTVVQTLLQKGADYRKKNNKGETALMIASSKLYAGMPGRYGEIVVALTTKEMTDQKAAAKKAKTPNTVPSKKKRSLADKSGWQHDILAVLDDQDQLEAELEKLHTVAFEGDERERKKNSQHVTQILEHCVQRSLKTGNVPALQFFLKDPDVLFTPSWYRVTFEHSNQNRRRTMLGTLRTADKNASADRTLFDCALKTADAVYVADALSIVNDCIKLEDYAQAKNPSFRTDQRDQLMTLLIAHDRSHGQAARADEQEQWLTEKQEEEAKIRREREQAAERERKEQQERDEKERKAQQAHAALAYSSISSSVASSAHRLVTQSKPKKKKKKQSQPKSKQSVSKPSSSSKALAAVAKPERLPTGGESERKVMHSMLAALRERNDEPMYADYALSLDTSSGAGQGHVAADEQPLDDGDDVIPKVADVGDVRINIGHICDGNHHDYAGRYEKQGKIEIAVPRHPLTGVYQGYVGVGVNRKLKSFFPSSWKKGDVLAAVDQAVQNLTPLEKPADEQHKRHVDVTVKGGHTMKLELVLNRSETLVVTAYPLSAEWSVPVKVESNAAD